MYYVFLTIKTNEQGGREIIKNEFIRNTRDCVTHKNKDSMLTVLKPGKFNVNLICRVSLYAFAWWEDSHDNVASSMSALVSASCEPERSHGALSCSHHRTMLISSGLNSKFS